MNLYAESSAILAWLLAEPAADAVVDLLRQASLVVTSDLTLVECDRVLIRAEREGAISEAERADRHAALNGATARWHVLRLAADIVDRARQPFPGEPIRTLDALHVASAVAARAAVPHLAVLTLDNSIRSVARRLGFDLVPA
jgi:predicted nucleic acid-binding protein